MHPSTVDGVSHRRNLPRPLLIAAVAALCGASIAFAAFGRGVSRRASTAVYLQTEERSAAVLLAGADVSASDRRDLPVFVQELADLPKRVNTSRTWLTLFSFDNRVQELYCRQFPDSDEAFLEEVSPKLQPLSKHDNTYLAPLFVTLGQRARRLTGRAVIWIGTDYFGEGGVPVDHATIRATATDLAANPRVIAVVVEGVAPENMAQLRWDLAPLTAKLQVVSTGRLDTKGIADLLASGGDH